MKYYDILQENTSATKIHMVNTKFVEEKTHCHRTEYHFHFWTTSSLVFNYFVDDEECYLSKVVNAEVNAEYHFRKGKYKNF